MSAADCKEAAPAGHYGRLCFICAASPVADGAAVAKMTRLCNQGNTQPKRPTDSSHDDHPGGHSPPPSPGSPLVYSPQVAMEPILPQGGRGQESDMHGISGWPAQPKLVPTVIVCTSPLSHIARPCTLTCSRGYHSNTCLAARQGVMAAVTSKLRVLSTTGQLASLCSAPAKTLLL